MTLAARRVLGGSSPFLSRRGQSVSLNGRPFRFVGFNVWRAAVASWNLPPNTGYNVNDGTTLDTSLKDLLAGGAKINTIRAFFQQQFAVHRLGVRPAGFPVTASGTAQNTAAVTTVSAGDLVLCTGRASGVNNFPTAISGGGATNWAEVDHFFDGSSTVWLWFGTVSSPGASTVTLTWNASNAGQTIEIVVDSFQGRTANTTWTAEYTGAACRSNSASSATVTYPTLTVGHQSDLYYGFARIAQTVSSNQGNQGFTYQNCAPNYAVSTDWLANGSSYGTTQTTSVAGAYNALATIFHAANSDSVYDWTAFDKVLSVAAANGFKVVAALADEWSYETDNNASGSGTGALTTPFYGSWNGSVFTAGTYSTGPWTWFEVYSYRQFVSDVVTRYKNDSRILFWELGNEMTVENPINTPDANAEPILAGFVADMGALVKGIDSNHLLSLGVAGNGNGGTSSGDYQTIHSSPYLDLCSYHDYQPYAIPSPNPLSLTADQRYIQSYDANNGLNVRNTQAAALNKPLYIGEAGLHANAAPASGNLTTTSPGRGYYLNQKMLYAFGTYGGIVGYLPWQYDDRGIGSDDYNYGPTDPSLGVVSSYGL